jgi:hypothetical protein
MPLQSAGTVTQWESGPDAVLVRFALSGLGIGRRAPAITDKVTGREVLMMSAAMLGLYATYLDGVYTLY